MSKTYIPKGTIERYDHLTTDTLVVHGRLIVKGAIRAARICGNGVIEAGTVRATSIVADTLDAERINARTVIANRVLCIAAEVSGGIIARDYIEAVDVKTGRLSASITKIERLKAKEIIETAPKSGFLWIIFSSWFTERFMRGWHRRVAKRINKASASAIATPKITDPRDTEFNCVVTAYKEKYLTGKYRLVLESVDLTRVDDKNEAA